MRPVPFVLLCLAALFLQAIPATAHEAPGRSSYDFRLVTSRKLYDGAVSVDKSPSLRGLAATAALHLHPLDLERLGVATGGVVKVSSPRTTANLLAVADPGLERGSAWLAFNLPDAAAADFVDVSAAVTSIRVETVPA